MAKLLASAGASARVATALTAAVRIAVMAPASISASKRPCVHSKSNTLPWREWRES